ncbi:MAG: histidinol-phosphate transaminase, partial [Myxococcales bacterium]|nr:histidinol-phosphate transaminase [Myxococcales bacterium]
ELGIKNAVKLASNENPVGPSPKVLARIAEVAPTIHRYPDASAFRLRRRLSELHGVPMEHIAVGNGSNELIDLICRTFAGPEDHAVIGVPSFVCYPLSLTAANVPFTAVPLRDHTHWNADDLLAAVTPKTKLLFLANPNNPTGTYLPAADLERLLRALPPHVIPVLDEAYVEFVDGTDYASALGMRSLHANLIILRTFSKAYALAALRVGYAIAPPLVVDYLNRVRAPFNVGTLGQEAALAALDDRAHVDAYLALNRIERASIEKGFAALELPFAPSSTNFVFVNVGRPGNDVYTALLHRGVIVRPMPAPVGQWLRVSVGQREENARMLTCLNEVLKG